MEKQPTQDEITRVILNWMCKVVDEHDLSIGFNKGDLRDILPNVVRPARFELALGKLLSVATIELRGGRYYLSPPVYEKYVENQDSENEESDLWQTIKVENYEEVAGKIEEFSTVIKSENGLRSSHPEETDFVIKTAEGAAESLRSNEGKITRKWLSTLIDGAGRILENCDKAARIAGVILAFVAFISAV